MSNAPHDLFFKKTFGRLEVAAGFLRHNLPRDLASRLDLERLERLDADFVDETLGAAYSDLLFRAPFRDQVLESLLIYLLFEHKSHPDPLTPFQILRYVVRIWEEELAAHGGSRLPPVYPMVFYHGREPWRGPLNLHGLLRVRHPDLRPHIPDFEVVLYDISHVDDEEIRGEALSRIVQLGMKYVFRDDLEEHLPGILELGSRVLLARDSLDIIHELLYYLVRGTGRLPERKLRQALAHVKRGETIMETFIDRYIEQGLQQGLEQGLEQGLQQGLEQGLREGTRDVLRRQLRRRFGALPCWAEERLRQADRASLDAWCEAIFDAASLEELLGGEG